MSLYPANFSDGSRFGRGWHSRYDVQAWHAFRQAVTRRWNYSVAAQPGRSNRSNVLGPLVRLTVEVSRTGCGYYVWKGSEKASEGP